jgi:arginase family enzyme
VTTSAVFFPFDLFGSAGASVGADLLADAFREMIKDNRRERIPTRADAYNDLVRIRSFSFGTIADYGDWRRQGQRAVRQVLRGNDFLLWITGNHLGVLPVYEELAAQPNEALVVQFDAHLDIHHFADCTSELSHGNFLLHCQGGLPKIINLGHRDLLLPPEHVSNYFRRAFSMEQLLTDTDAALKQIQEATASANRIFLDVDCDVFDPAFFPAVANPLPFGLSPQLFLRLVNSLWSERIIGVAISEFDPARDVRDQSLATLSWFLEYLLLKRHEGAVMAGAKPDF